MLTLWLGTSSTGLLSHIKNPERVRHIQHQKQTTRVKNLKEFLHAGPCIMLPMGVQALTDAIRSTEYLDLQSERCVSGHESGGSEELKQGGCWIFRGYNFDQLPSTEEGDHLL